jgi:hypothetical protein
MRFALSLLLILAATSAMASPNCMTQREARAQYHTSYIYWRTENHCWYAGHPSHAARHVKRSAPALQATQHAERLPNREAAEAGADTVSIWPDPPTDYSWVDRWPNQRVGEPEKWLFDLMQFGSK